MSRLDEAIAAIDEAVAELSSAIDTHLAADKAALEQAQMAGDSQPSGADNGASDSGVSQGELQAMKSELHEAMSLLQAIQDVPQSKEGQ